METTLTLSKPHSLCLPATIDGGPASTHNAFACYRGKLPGGVRIESFEAEYTDMFGNRTVASKKLSAFCVPVDVAGGGIANPDDYRACYKSKPGKGQPKLEATVDTDDALGTLSLRVGKESEVCAPAKRVD
jgi:hypothetical protein